MHACLAVPALGIVLVIQGQHRRLLRGEQNHLGFNWRSGRLNYYCVLAMQYTGRQIWQKFGTRMFDKYDKISVLEFFNALYSTPKLKISSINYCIRNVANFENQHVSKLLLEIHTQKSEWKCGWFSRHPWQNLMTPKSLFMIIEIRRRINWWKPLERSLRNNRIERRSETL